MVNFKNFTMYYNLMGTNMLGSYLQRGMPNRIIKHIKCEILDGKKIIKFKK